MLIIFSLNCFLWQLIYPVIYPVNNDASIKKEIQLIKPRKGPETTWKKEALS